MILGIIIGILLSILVVVSSRRYKVEEKITEKIENSFKPRQQAMIIDISDPVSELEETLKNEKEN